ncbi:DUF1835 domain-containing protein [Mucilaginibacter sp. Bleaf8]|uniref:DUF1835 domain-containing protein n=1 Tax=Mucilaginibacter sp. Bleaf8 TaxID=2834430 RepID=UPI001BD049DE|nr:DUF1835 domain-containing protein [Mucilaginibacter sp. Bleaf8]MBS7566600.1 DUF1835 domain-containing protein [Mucilaginibacter sp. Bleaf8]
MTLQILNGDATLNGFNKTGLDGDVLVWREVFSEGPLMETLDADFWKTREAWITETFNATAEGYQQKVLLELEKLNEPYSEINLWFEFDLHCQVNLLGVMQLLQRQADLTERSIFLICPDSHPDVLDFRGMGELTGAQLEDVFDNRLQLSEYDFTIAAEAWQAYTSGNATRLAEWIAGTPFWGSLHMLKPALEAHIKRLHVNQQGLTYMEATLLLLYQSGATQRDALYEAFWKQHKIYGMGDWELDIYLNKLQSKGLINSGK